MARKSDGGLVDVIAEDLRGKIVRGDIAPGEQLRQDDIAAQFGASSNPVREAFQRLERTGLVILRPRRGVIASSIKPADAIEVAHMRSALEVLALKEAMKHADEGAAASARYALESSGSSSKIATWISTNRDFHMSLYRPCGWDRLVTSIEELWLTSDRHLHAVWSQVNYQDRSQAEHIELLDAYTKGDFEAASKILSSHIIEAGKTLAELLARSPLSMSTNLTT
jgi:DNA-binding GntR family transcriptional regulator